MVIKLMVQGTMSNSGKSFLVAALCRIFQQDGYRVAPFKSQNMALNSYITRDGLEIGRAQAMQAEAAGIAPTVDMNPILLKPTSHMGSQVIVNGEVYGNMKAMDYYRRKPEFIPVIREAFARLEEEYDIIVLEGAGSPAEINLRDNDIVNMGMAKLVDAPVLLVGDIDRGGVFASLYGTVSLLEEDEQQRIKGLIINKFRGDVKILEPGLRMIEDRLHIPVLGVIPMEQIDIDDEDSLSERLNPGGGNQRSVAGQVESENQGQVESGNQEQAESENQGKPEAENREKPNVYRNQGLDIAVIHLPHISNFTDFNVFDQYPGVSVRYVKRPSNLGTPDLMILPGTKNTMDDLTWLRESGMEAQIIRLVTEKIHLIGICGGYQMLGEQLSDPDGVEHGGTMRGMGLLPTETVFAKQKTRTQIVGTMCPPAAAQSALAVKMEDGQKTVTESDFGGIYTAMSGMPLTGYEIHMGVTRRTSVDKEAENAASGGQSDAKELAQPAILLEDGRTDGFIREDGLVFGSYLHGLFDNEVWTRSLLDQLAARKGIHLETSSISRDEYKESQYNKLADLVRGSLDMNQIYKIMGR